MNELKTCGQCQREIPSHAPFGICPVCVLNLATEQSEIEKTDSRSQPSGDSVPEPHELMGKFPNLEIESLLGRGGMGAVYLARQTSLDRIVALKVLSSGLADDPSFTERFAREAKTLAKLTHPNIVTVFDSGQTGDASYLVMEYIDGVNLRDAIVSRTIDPARALAIVQQICDALQHAHDAGVIHRDIKPENILIDRHGLVKIADFGLAKLLQPKPEQYSLTGTRQVLGTRNYMAPEQIETPDSVDHRADLYSLGVVLYELLTGELPIGRFAPPSSKSGCSEQLDELVMRTLEKEPGRRFQQASMIGSAVRELESSIEQLAAKTPLVEAITRSELTSPYRQDHEVPLTEPLPFSMSNLVLRYPANWTKNLTMHVANIQGLLHAYEDRLELEYRINDTYRVEDSKSRANSVRLDNLASVQFEPTWWGGARVRFQAMSLSAIEDIPNAKQGAFSVKVSNRNRAAASEFADITNRKIISRNPQRSGARRDRNLDPTVTLEEIVLLDERLKVPTVGFWIAGIGTFLIGVLLTAAGIMSISNQEVRSWLHNTVPVGPNAIYFLGPFFLISWLLPLIAAHLLKQHRSYHFAIVLLLAMLTPWVSPLFLLQVPLALWALIVLCLPSTRKVFREASLRDRMNVNKKPVIKRIPSIVFAAAIIGPLVFAGIGIGWWNVAGHEPLHNAEQAQIVQSKAMHDEARLSGPVTFDPDLTSIVIAPDQPEQVAAPPREHVPKALPERFAAGSPPMTARTDVPRLSFVGIFAAGFLIFVSLFLVIVLTLLGLRMTREYTKN